MPFRKLLRLGLVLGVALWAGEARSFSDKPIHVDPELDGWAAPLQTLCFQAGCGRLFYVAGVYLADRELTIVCLSKVTLQRADRRALQSFSQRLIRSVAAAARDLAERGVVDSVVLTVSCAVMRGGERWLEEYESAMPAGQIDSVCPAPLRVSEARMDVYPPP